MRLYEVSGDAHISVESEHLPGTLEQGQTGHYTEDITSVANFRLSAAGCV